MKIIDLQLEGFTCYQKKTRVDFSDLELFAITGATGSGKSSLVDAIVFALYGKTPRMGNDLFSLISQGRKKMSVLLEFKSGDKLYKVGRRMQSGKRSQAVLDFMDCEKWRGMCSGIKQVNRKIVTILGVDYDTFTRCTVLPQGAFSQFLQESKSRQNILVGLLGLEVLGEMQKKASKNYEQSKEKALQLQLRLDETEGVSAKNLKQIEEELSELDENVQAQQLQIEKMSLQRRELCESIELAKTLKDLERQHSLLIPVQKEVECLQRKINIARKALPLLPEFRQIESTRAKVVQLQKNRGQLRDQEISLLSAEQKAKEDMEKAERNYAKLPQLEKRFERVQEIRRIDKQLIVQREKLGKDENLYEQNLLRYGELQKRLREARSSIEKKREQKRISQKNLQRLEAGEKIFHKFQGTETFMQMLAEAKEECNKKSDKLKRALQAYEEKKKQLQESLDDFTRCESELIQLREKIGQAGIRLELENELFKLEEAYHLKERVKERQNESRKEQRLLTRDREKCEKIAGEIGAGKEEIDLLKAKYQAISRKFDAGQKGLLKARELLPSCLELEQRARALRENSERLEQERQLELKTVEKCEKRLKSLKKEKSVLEKAANQVRREWMEASAKDMACSLRGQIKTGDKCPVCMQKVEKVPKSEKISAALLKKLQEEAEEKRKLLGKLDGELTENKTLLDIAEKTSKALSKRLLPENLQEKEAKKRLLELREQLAKILGPGDCRKALKKKSETISRMGEELRLLQIAISEKQTFVNEREAAISTLEQMQKDREAGIVRSKEAVQSLREKIKTLVGRTNVEKQKLETRKKLDDLAILEKELAAAEKSFAKMSWQKEVAQRQVAEVENSLECCRQELQLALESRQQKQNTLKKRLGIEAEDIEQAIAQGIEQYRNICQNISEVTAKIDNLRVELGKREVAQARDESTCEEISRAISELEKQISERKNKNERMESEIFQVTCGEDAEILLKRLRQQKSETEDHYRKARELALITEEQLKSCQREKVMIEEKCDEMEQEMQNLEENFSQILQELGLDLERLLEMKIDPKALSQWEQQVAKGQAQIQELGSRLQDCRNRLKGCDVSASTLSKLEKNLQAAKLSLASSLEKRGQLSQRIEHMKKTLGLAKRLQEDFKRENTTLEVYRQLSWDLRADRFPGYVLEQALAALTEDGSVQLEMLSSGRYGFSLVKREIFVIDHWNDDQMRPAKTLSGGETFIASLALALALADRIYQMGSQMGGSLALESLFIDEGFGTLDEEHLDVVVKALNNIQDTGRTIGIISHLTLLNNYLPARLVVSKDPDGSTIRREWA